MSFVRPAARAAIWQWREVLMALVVLALGAYWGFATGGLITWIGYGLLAIGGALLATGLQRGRFRGNRGGPGVVLVDEGQVTYLGPLTGGAVALGEVTALSFDPTGRPPHWVLAQPGQPDLMIPLTAEGSDALFDAFASLPGIRTEHMLRHMKTQAGQPVVIWQKPGLRLH